MQRGPFTGKQRINALLRHQEFKAFRSLEPFFYVFYGNPIIVFLRIEIVASRNKALRIRGKAAQRRKRAILAALRPEFSDLCKGILPLLRADPFPLPNEAQRRLLHHCAVFRFHPHPGQFPHGLLFELFHGFSDLFVGIIGRNIARVWFHFSINRCIDSIAV